MPSAAASASLPPPSAPAISASRYVDARRDKDSHIETSHYARSGKDVSECNKEVIYEMLKVKDSELNAQLKLEEPQQHIVQAKRQMRHDQHVSASAQHDEQRMTRLTHKHFQMATQNGLYRRHGRDQHRNVGR